MTKMLASWVLITVCVIALTAPAYAKHSSIYIGITADEIVDIYGKPNEMYPIDTAAGKFDVYYKSMKIEFSHNLVKRWSGHALKVLDTYPPLVYGTTREGVVAAWGTPPTASLMGDFNAKGEEVTLERWTYKKSTLFFFNDHLVGWDNYDKFSFSLSQKGTGAIPTRFGATAQDVIRAATVPDGFLPLNEHGNGEWRYGVDSLIFVGDKIAGWINPGKSLAVDFGRPNAFRQPPTLGSPKDDVSAALGTPMAILPCDGGGNYWVYDKQAFVISTAGIVTMMATKRLQGRLIITVPKLEEWPAMVHWIVNQPYLDDVSAITARVIDTTSLYNTFLATNDQRLCGLFKNSESNKLISAYSGGSNSRNGFLRGVQDALSCSGVSRMQQLATGASQYAQGAKTVYSQYVLYLDTNYKQYIATSVRTVPNLKGRSAQEATNLLAQLGLTCDVVNYKDPTLRNITDTVPAAGQYLPVGSMVVVYAAIE